MRYRSFGTRKKILGRTNDTADCIFRKYSKEMQTMTYQIVVELPLTAF